MNQVIEGTLDSNHDTDAPKHGTKELVGGTLSALVILFMTFDGVNKVIVERHVVTAMRELGWPISLSVPLGVVILVCTALYAVRRTALLGGILLTAFLGGATATHLRLEQMNFLFAVMMGVLVWTGLCLRDERLRNLVTRG